MLVLLQNKKTCQYYYKIKRHVSIITKQKDMLVLLQNKKTYQCFKNNIHNFAKINKRKEERSIIFLKKKINKDL